MKKTPCTVQLMGLENFHNFASLASKTNSPLVHRKKTVDGEPFMISKVVWFRVMKDQPGKRLFKTSFNEYEFVNNYCIVNL